MDYYPEFARLLNALLTSQDRSPAWLSRQLAVNSGTVSRWLNHGTRPGSSEMVGSIADILGQPSQKAALLMAAGYGYQEEIDKPAATESPMDANLRSQAERRRVLEKADRQTAAVTEYQPSATHSATIYSPSNTNQPPSLSNTEERKVFVGREGQLAELEDALAQSLAGRGQLRFITGEAGAGKSALLVEFGHRAKALLPRLVIAIGACDAQTGLSDPYLPFREILAHLAHPEIGGRILPEVGPELIGTLVPSSALGTPGRGQGRWPESKRLEQSQIFDQVVKVLQTIAQQVPLVLELEDLHWADDASIGLLFRLGRLLEDSRILIVGTYRSEEVSIGRSGEPHPLQKVVDLLRRNLGEIHTNLDAAQAAEGQSLVEALLDTEPNRLDAHFRRELYAHTGGHPLFVVELLRDFQKTGAIVKDQQGKWVVRSGLKWTELPARVEGIIALRMARLDDEERQILTTASVLGEHFIAEAVAQVLKIDNRQVALQLSGSLQNQHRLVQSEGIERLGQQRLTRYRFSHNLMQVYLYEQLDEVQRAFWHEDVGYVLEELYSGEGGTVAVQLAHHFQVAGIGEKAAHYLASAGEQAFAAAAYNEAITHLARALSQLEALPETVERLDQKLSLLRSLGVAQVAVKGAASPEAALPHMQMHELLPKLGQNSKLFPTLMVLDRFYAVRGEGWLQRENAERALQIAQTIQDPTLLLAGHHIMGSSLCFSGRFALARPHLEQFLALYDPRQEYALHLPEHRHLSSNWIVAMTWWHLGYPDQARRRLEQALTLVRWLSNHKYVAVHIPALVAWHHHVERDVAATLQMAEETISLAAERGFTMLEAHTRCCYGWALAAQGEITTGIAEMQRGVAELKATGEQIFWPYAFAKLGEIYAKTGQIKDGLMLVSEALETVERTTYHLWKTELLLQQGMLHVQQKNGEEAAEASFLSAIEVARQQSAKMMELRATVSLARLWRTQGKRKPAHTMLSEIYAWFTEGFDTQDLREAKAVLDRWSDEA